MKRILALLLVVGLTATGYAMFENGGFIQLLKDTFVQQNTEDAYTEVDTVVITSAKFDSLLVATATLTAPSQFAMLQFSPGTVTAALRDSTRFVTRVGTGPVSDTLKLNVKLSAATANGDTVILSFYEDAGVNTDTVSTVEHEWPYTFAHNVIWSRLDGIVHDDSTGVLINIQTKFGATDDWATIASHALDADNEEAYTVLSDSSATVQMGSRFRTMVITYDSTRGARTNASTVEVVWKGRK